MNVKGVVITTALFAGIIFVIISALFFVGYLAVSSNEPSSTDTGASGSNATNTVIPTVPINLSSTPSNRTTPVFGGGGGGGGGGGDGGDDGGTASNQAPTAVISATPTGGVAPLSVVLNTSSSSDPEGQPISYLWTIQDTPSNTTNTNVSLTHVFNTPGNYSIQLRVTDSAGASSTANAMIIVCPLSNPSCDQIIDSTSPVVTLTTPLNGASVTGTNITFSYQASDNSALRNATLYVWNSVNTIVAQQTQNLSGTTASSNFASITLPPVTGVYRWNVLTRDSSNNAAWASANYTLTYAKVPLFVVKDGTGLGTVASDIGGINCGTTCSSSFDEGEVVTLTAIPNVDSAVASFSDVTCGAGSGPTTCKITLGSVAQTARVTFNLISTPSTLAFVAPTPADGSSSQSSSLVINVSSSDALRHYAMLDFDRDLRLWMTMDATNASGDPQDLSSWNNHGSRRQGATTASGGMFGNTLSLQQGTQKPYLKVPDSASLRLNDSQMTVSVWFKRNSEYSYYDATSFNNGTGPWTTLVSKVDMIARDGWELDVENNKTLVYMRRNNVGIANVLSVNSVTDNVWTHVAFTYDGSFVKLYINGVLDNSGPVVVPWEEPSDALYIGARSPEMTPLGSSLFNGSLDDVMIFGRSLSAQEIYSLYDANALQYSHTFNGLPSKNYTFAAHTVNAAGSTDAISRTVELTSPSGGLISVCTPQELNSVRNNLAGNYIQTCDIDISSIPWVPIGINGGAVTPFTGTYNGNGWSISGLSVTSASGLASPTLARGLFAMTENAQLSFITLNGGTIELGGGETGGIVGTAVNTILDQMQVNNLNILYTFNLSSPYSAAGGIVGYASNVTMTNAYVSNSIIEGIYAGGIVGSVYEDGALDYSPSTFVGLDISSTTVQGKTVGGAVGMINSAGGIPQILSDVQTTGVQVFCDDYGTPFGDCSAGGAVGILGSSYVQGVYVRGQVEDVSTHGVVGGVIGQTDVGPTMITETHTRTNVTGNGNVGGFAGILNGYGTPIYVDDSSVRGGNVQWNPNSLSSDPARKGHGGFAGVIGDTVLIDRSFSTASVVGGDSTGGFAGLISGMDSSITDSYAVNEIIVGGDPAGGFVGDPGQGIIRTSYVASTIFGSFTVGGFSGLPVSGVGEITDSYWNAEIALGASDSPEGTAVSTTTEMFQEATFHHWDFGGIWSITEGSDYPRSQWEPSILFAPEGGNFVQRNFGIIMVIHLLLFVVLLIALIVFYYRSRAPPRAFVPGPAMTPSRPPSPSSPSPPTQPRPVQLQPRAMSAPVQQPRPQTSSPMQFRRPVQFGNTQSTTRKP